MLNEPPKKVYRSTEGNIYFRRYEEKEKGFALHCITDRHEPLNFKRMDELTCLGTAIGVIHE